MLGVITAQPDPPDSYFWQDPFEKEVLEGMTEFAHFSVAAGTYIVIAKAVLWNGDATVRQVVQAKLTLAGAYAEDENYLVLPPDDPNFVLQPTASTMTLVLMCAGQLPKAGSVRLSLDKIGGPSQVKAITIRIAAFSAGTMAMHVIA